MCAVSCARSRPQSRTDTKSARNRKARMRFIDPPPKSSKQWREYSSSGEGLKNAAAFGRSSIQDLQRDFERSGAADLIQCAQPAKTGRQRLSGLAEISIPQITRWVVEIRMVKDVEVVHSGL